MRYDEQSTTPGPDRPRGGAGSRTDEALAVPSPREDRRARRRAVDHLVEEGAWLDDQGAAPGVLD